MKIIKKGLHGISLLYHVILFKTNNVKRNKGLKIYGILRLAAARGGVFEMGRNVLIRSSWRSNMAGGGQTHTMIRVCNGAKLILGENVGISNSTIYCSKRIVIEDDVCIGVNCIISDTDHHSVYLEDRVNGNRNIKSEPVLIKKGAWICGHCIILKGVTIGKKSVLGAGSILTKSIPDGELWAGNPARFIKKLY